ncbi:MAG: nitrilase-related carbon-nitrogen hydrolase, partial [Candidatus Bathyarchaeia archaeon]
GRLSMKVGYIQFEPIFGDKDRNLKTILRLLEEAVDQEAELLVLPELCNTGYVFRSQKELEALSENIPNGRTTQTLIKFAEESSLYIVAGLCEEADGRYYNSAVLVGPGGFIANYRKTHLFNEENLWFSKGDIPFEVYNASKVRIGIMICFDWFFPEVIRILALKGAQIVCHPSNLILPYCQQAILGAAVQNRVFIITANRIGTERGVEFTGMSQIVDPNMKVLARSGKDMDVKIVEIDPKAADSKRINKYNDLWLDRRVDLYSPLLA